MLSVEGPILKVIDLNKDQSSKNDIDFNSLGNSYIEL